MAQLYEKIEKTKGKNSSEILNRQEIIRCEHCGEIIKRTQLIGISLRCPLCGKPRNGIMHKN
jgi:rubrerythrin